MKNQLGAVDVAIWATQIVAQLVLLLSITRRQLYQRLPGFSAYVLVSVLDSILLFVIAFFADYATYYRTFYLAGHVVSAFAFLTLMEFGWQVLPGLELPRKKQALGCLLIAIALILIFVWFWPIHSLGNEKRIEIGACLIVAATFAFIAGYSRFIGLHWSRLVGGVAFTLGIIHFMDGVMKALIGHVPFSIAVHIRQTRQLVGVLSIIAWIVVVLSPWGEYPMSETDLENAENVIAGTEVSLRSLALEGSTKA
jgi:hypothetical protein